VFFVLIFYVLEEKQMSKTVTIESKSYTVEYVPKCVLSPAFGFAYNDCDLCQVRDDLTPLVGQFVEEHELYHLKDRRTDGIFKRELRANLIPDFKDPIGFIATV
jgi:hypothetical protein